MYKALCVTLIMLAPLLAAPQFEDDHHNAAEETEVAARWSEEEVTTKHLELEDPTSWSASTEVLDENHAWYRRRRSVEEMPADDMLAAESVVFIPSHIRNRKKLAHEECRRHHREFATWKRLNNHQGTSRNRCNSYCCYPVAD